MIEMDTNILQKKAQRLCQLLKKTNLDLGADLRIELIKTDDAIGGGAFPARVLPGFGAALSSSFRSAENLAAALRMADVPVIANIRDEQLVLHVRTLLDGDERIIVSSFTQALGAKGV